MNIEDSTLIEAIKGNNERRRDWALYLIYSNSKYQEFARNYIINHDGLEIDVEDVFQESIILLDRNLRNGTFKGESTLGTYLIAIVKWTWLGLQRKKKIHQVEIKDDFPEIEDRSFEASLLKEERKQILDLAISTLGEKCRKLLGYYKLDHTMAEIAGIMGFSSPEMAKKQAYRCREKLKDFFMRHKEYLEVLKNN